MNLARRAGFLGKSAALWVIMALAALCTSLGALGFFTAAFLIWLSDYLGNAAAFAIAGVMLLVVTGLIALVFTLILRRMRARQPSLAAEGLGSLSMVLRLATFAIQKDPRRAVLGALIAGAIAEYFSGDRRPKA